MKTAAAMLTLLVLTGLAAACSQTREDERQEVYLKCAGETTVWNEKAGPLPPHSDEAIAVHIKDSTINFSGNSILSGSNIPICRDRQSTVELYFDSETCEERKSDPKRKYGTFNRVLLTLDVTNLVSANGVAWFQGSFKCVKVDPVPK